MRTLYDLYCSYVSPEVMVKFMRKARGQFVTLIKVGIHLIECISGHNSFVQCILSILHL